jgi:hypothetical protein
MVLEFKEIICKIESEFIAVKTIYKRMLFSIQNLLFGN